MNFAVKTEEWQGVKKVYLPSSISLWSAAGRELVNALLSVAENLYSDSPQKALGVLLLQEGPADDFESDWLAQLDHSLLLDDLAADIERFRWLLSLIRHSPIPWVYAAASHCFGSYWELALSCQKRFWFSMDAQVGFPEIVGGVFPPGGVLESLDKKASRTRDRWQQSPILTAARAMEEGLIHFASDADDWESIAGQQCLEVLSGYAKMGEREAGRSFRRLIYDDKDAESRQTALRQLESMFAQEKLRTSSPPAAWDYCWQLIKARGRLNEIRDLGRLISHLVARHFLSPTYRFWLAGEIIGNQSLLDISVTQIPLPPITIDLAQVPPPTSVLLRLLHAGLRVMFVAPLAKDLISALELLYNRLERASAVNEIQRLWEAQVSWCVGKGDDERGVVLSWSVDDRFMISHEGNRLNLLRLDGNDGLAAPGVMEWSSASLETVSSPILALAQQASDGIVKTHSPAGIEAVASQLRADFFSELIEISAYRGNELLSVIEALQANGWQFAGSEERWDRFLRLQNAHVFELSSWKAAKAHVKKQPPGDQRWNATAVSQHMAIFSGLLAERTAARGFIAERAQADLLVSKALGFPVVYGTPLTYIARRGRYQVKRYARTHWPNSPLLAQERSDG